MLVGVAIAALVVAGAPVPVAAQSRAPWPAADAAGRGADYIVARQEANGSLLPGDARADEVANGVLALVAATAGRDPVERALAYMAGRPIEEMTRGGQLGRAVMAIVAGRKNPRDFGGKNYLRALQDEYNPATGAYDPGIYGQALAILGVVAAGETVPDMAITYLRPNECRDLGFGHDPGCPGGADVDTSAMVLSAMIAARVAPADNLRVRTRDYLLSVQNRSGGYGYKRGEKDNANSTALALSAVAALGENPAVSPWARPDGANPVSVLTAFQQPDSGGFRVDQSQSAPDYYATFQAVPALAGVPYPVPPRASAASTPTTAPGSSPSPSRTTPGDGSGVATTVTTRPPDGSPPGPSAPGAVDPGGDGPDAGGQSAAARRDAADDDDVLPATLIGTVGLLMAAGAGVYLRRRART